MSPAALDEHRKKICSRIEHFLRHYWHDNEMDPVAQASILADWANDLEDWSLGQIEWALTHWRQNETKKPCPAHVLRLLKGARGEAEARRAAVVKREVAAPLPTPEERLRGQALLDELLPGVVKRMPEARMD